MSSAFDPYYTWLGIPPQEQPPHHYRLLCVQLFEPDAEVIANAADARMAHVRTFQQGVNAAHSQRLLNEIARAKTCLLNLQQKQKYDAQLYARFAPRPKPLSPPIAPPPVTPLQTSAPAIAMPEPAAPAVREGIITRLTRQASVRWVVTAIVATACFGLIAFALIVWRVYHTPKNLERVIVNSPPPPAQVPQEPRGNFSLAEDRTTARFAAFPLNATPPPAGNTTNPSIAGGETSPEIYELKLGPPQNLLTSIDPIVNLRMGQFDVLNNGDWRFKGINEFDVVELPLPPPGLPPEYLLEAVFLPEFNNHEFGFGLIAEGHPCPLIVNAKTSYSLRASGLGLDPGRPYTALGLPNAVYRPEPLTSLLPPSTLVCAVLRDRVWAAIDGDQICNFTGDPTTLSLPAGLPGLSSKCLSLFAYDSKYVLQGLSFAPIVESRRIDERQFAAYGSQAIHLVSREPARSPLPTQVSPSEADLAEFNFDGATCFRITDRAGGQLLNAAEPYTIEMWVRLSSSPRPMGLLSTSQFELYFSWRPPESPRICLKSLSTGEIEVGSVQTPKSDMFHVAVVSYNNQRHVLVNGISSLTVKESSTGAGSPDVVPVLLGCAPSIKELLTGRVRAVRISTKRLYSSMLSFTPEQVLTVSPSCRAFIRPAGNALVDQMQRCAVEIVPKVDPPTSSAPNLAATKANPAPAAEKPKAPSTPVNTPAPRMPLPTEVERTAARKKLEDSFAQKLAEAMKPAAQSALAQDFITAGKTETDVALSYVLFVEARRLAVEAVDVRTAFDVTNLVTNRFEVDEFAALSATIKTLKERVTSSSDQSNLRVNAVTVAKRALTAERYDVADSLSLIALKLAATAPSSELAQARALRDDVEFFQPLHAAMLAAKEKLKTAPDDAEANLHVGKYQCLKQNDWTAGLAALEKSSDPAAVLAARLDLAAEATNLRENPEAGAAARIKAADAWYDLAAATKGAEKRALQQRARKRYQEGRSNVDLLDQARVDERLAELNKAMSSPGVAAETKGSKSKSTVKNITGAIVRLYVENNEGESKPTPFFFTASGSAVLNTISTEVVLARYRVESLRYSYVITGDLVVPSNMDVQVFARYAVGAIDGVPIRPAPGFEQFQGNLPLKRGTHRVELRGGAGQRPDWSFRDSQGKNLLFYSEADLAEATDKEFSVPAAKPYPSKGILLKQ